MKKKKVKKINKSALKKKCDSLFGAKIRSIGYCQAEGRTKIKCGGSLQCAHIVPRNVLRLRWNENNCLCLCASHHIIHFHRNPLSFIEFVAEYYPEKLAYVQKHRYEIKKMSVQDYEELYQKLKNENDS